MRPDLLQDANKKYHRGMLVCRTGNQLGNQLRHIQSCLLYCMKNDITFKIEPDERYRNLFFSCIDRTYFDIPNCDIHDVNESDAYTHIHCTNYDLIDETVFQDTFLDTIRKNTTCRLHSIYSARPPHTSINALARFKCDFYKKVFRIPSKVLSIVDHFLSQFKSIRVGVHMRLTDNMNDKMKTKLKYNTTLEEFIRRINDLSERYIVCTDDRACLSKIPPQNIVTVPIFNGVSNNEQVLIEMTILSKMHLLIGSRSSTFSYESFFMNSDPHKVFEEYRRENGGWHKTHMSELMA